MSELRALVGGSLLPRETHPPHLPGICRRCGAVWIEKERSRFLANKQFGNHEVDGGFLPWIVARGHTAAGREETAPPGVTSSEPQGLLTYPPEDLTCAQQPARKS